PKGVRKPVTSGSLAETSFAVRGPARHIRVMRVVPGQLVTGSEIVAPTAQDGLLVADPARDLVKIAVVERHHATGQLGVGFATNVGSRKGAFASTVAHAAHNIVVLGVHDAGMLLGLRPVARLGVGIVV